MNIGIYILCVILAIGMGTLNLARAADSYKEGRYGWFGWFIMNVIWMSAVLCRAIWIGIGG